MTKQGRATKFLEKWRYSHFDILNPTLTHKPFTQNMLLDKCFWNKLNHNINQLDETTYSTHFLIMLYGLHPLPTINSECIWQGETLLVENNPLMDRHKHPQICFGSQFCQSWAACSFKVAVPGHTTMHLHDGSELEVDRIYAGFCFLQLAAWIWSPGLIMSSSTLLSIEVYSFLGGAVNRLWSYFPAIEGGIPVKVLQWI